MIKLFAILCLLILSLTACEKSEDQTKKEDRQKTIMGDGKLKNLPPGQHLGGL